MIICRGTNPPTAVWKKNILRKTENFQLPLVNNLILIKKNTFLKFFNGKHRNLT
jgi:hypothetical protein